MTFLYVLLALLVFGLLVLIHELGHFLVAKAFGVGIREFSIGMGPKLFSWKGKKQWDNGEETAEQPADTAQKDEAPLPDVQQEENTAAVSDTDVAVAEQSAEAEQPEERVTTYSLRAFPIGGFVSMVGEDEENSSPASFEKKNVWKRIAIVLAGPVMNVVLGFILMLVLVLSTTHPDTGRTLLLSTTIGGFQDEAISHVSLQVNDVVTHVNGVPVHTGNELVYEIMNQGYEPLDLTVLRNGERVVLSDVIFPGMEEEGISFGSADFKLRPEETNFGNVLKHTFFRSLSTVKMIFDQLGDLLTGRFGLNAVSGPVGVTEAMGEAAQEGFTTFLYLVIIITVNLGVFNLLPVPALDGGRLMFLAVEAITRKPLNKKVEGYINFAGIMILFAIMILVTCKDIVGLFFR